MGPVVMEGRLTTEDKLRGTESGDLQKMAFWGRPPSLLQQWSSMPWQVRRSGIEGIEEMKARVTGKYFTVIGTPYSVIYTTQE